MTIRNVQHIQRDDPFVAPSTMPYWLVIVSRDPALTAQDRQRLAAQIAASPVCWIAAWGCASLQWEDALDGEIESRMAAGTCPFPACTASHGDDEPLADVLELTREVARFDGAGAEEVHILVVGGPADGLEELLRFPEGDA